MLLKRYLSGWVDGRNPQGLKAQVLVFIAGVACFARGGEDCGKHHDPFTCDLHSSALAYAASAARGLSKVHGFSRGRH